MNALQIVAGLANVANSAGGYNYQGDAFAMTGAVMLYVMLAFIVVAVIVACAEKLPR